MTISEVKVSIDTELMFNLLLIDHGPAGVRDALIEWLNTQLDMNQANLIEMALQQHIKDNA